MADQRLKPSKNAQVKILASPFDEGVKKNFGRPGAAKGPEAIKERLEKFYYHPTVRSYDWTEAKNTPPNRTGLKNYLGDVELIHLGGGHDTIVHALEVLQDSERFEKKSCLLINIDPHPDVRNPKDYGWTSGAGFFNVKENFPFIGEYMLIGAHHHSSAENHLKLVDEVVYFEDIPFSSRVSYVIQRIQARLLSFDHFFISVDLDSIENFLGVSAPAALGFYYQEIYQILMQLKKNPKYLGTGIYELSPQLDPTPVSVIKASKLVYMLLEAEKK